jgi:transcriptional regulator with XRE-family HTH domain
MKLRRLPPVTATLSQGPYRQRMSTLGQTLRQAQSQPRAALLDVAACVHKTDGTQLSPQYLSDIEYSRRQSSLHVLTEPARTLGLDEDSLLVREKRAESVGREYLLAHHAQGKAVIAFFRIANALYFEAWEHLRPLLLSGKI